MIGLKAKSSITPGDKEDMKRRKDQAKTFLIRLNKLWNDKNIKVATKFKMFKALVKSILIYNCSTWALTKTQEQ